MIKLFIGQVDFSPEQGRHQDVKILLDHNNCLPAGNNIEKIEESLGSHLEIGKIFYKTAVAEYWFANIKGKVGSSEWQFQSLKALSPENCSDYSVVIKAVELLGYEP